MNNSELSTANSSEDASMVSETYVYPPSRDSSIKNWPQGSTVGRSENFDNRVTGVERALAAGNENRDTRTVEARLVANQPDLDLWLLDHSPEQYAQWESI